MNGLENNREAGDLRRYGAHYDVIVLGTFIPIPGYTIFMLRQALEPGSRKVAEAFHANNVPGFIVSNPKQY